MKEPSGNFDQLINAELEKEEKQIDQELRADEKVVGAKASASLDEKVKKRIEQYEQEQLISKLSDEDREALRLGRELQERQRTNDQKVVQHRKRKAWRRVVACAAVLVIVLATGITSVGGPKRVVEIVEQVVGGRKVTKVTSDNEETKISESEKEEQAYQQIRDELGIDSVKITSKERDMVFKEITIDKNIQMAQMIYDSQGGNISYNMSVALVNSSWGIDVEDELLNQYSYQLGQTQAEIKEYELLESKSRMYEARFEYQGVHYQLIATINKENFKMILNNLFFPHK